MESRFSRREFLIAAGTVAAVSVSQEVLCHAPCRRDSPLGFCQMPQTRWRTALWICTFTLTKRILI